MRTPRVFGLWAALLSCVLGLLSPAARCPGRAAPHPASEAAACDVSAGCRGGLQSACDSRDCPVTGRAAATEMRCACCRHAPPSSPAPGAPFYLLPAAAVLTRSEDRADALGALVPAPCDRFGEITAPPPRA